MSVRKLVLLCVLLLTLGLVACGDDAGTGETAENGDIPPALSEEDAAAILDNLDEHEGEEVTVTTAIAEVLGDRGILVYSHATSGDKVLVMTDAASDLSTGDIVEITGTVREFDGDAVTEADVDPADPAYEPYFGEQVVMASEVSVVQGSS